MGISWEDQVEACWAMKVVRLASVKWEVRYSGMRNVFNDSIVSLKQGNKQNLLFPRSFVHCSQGEPGEQGEHFVLERWHAQHAPALRT